jgi:intracellular sulfur oxidation DsrE/DsrF family protein
VKELTDIEMMQKYIDKAEELNVELIACGFSLKKFEVDKKDISPELKVVENGILHNFRLQKKGYTSISL